MNFDEIVELAIEITVGIVALALIGLFFFITFPVIGVMLALVAGIGIIGLLIFAIVAAAVVAVDICQRGLKFLQNLFFN